MSNYWKKDGVEFDEFYGPLGRFSPRKIIARFLGKRTAVLQEFIGDVEGKKILDLGCGSGIQMRQLAPLCQQIAGVDVSEPMLAAAKRLLEELPKKNWELILSDAGHMPFAASSFDVVFNLGLLDYVESPEAILQECLRVLRPGGDLIFTIPKHPSPFSFFRTRLGIILRRHIFHLPPILNSVSREELAGLLKNDGLRVIKVVSIWQTMWVVKAKKI